MSVVKRFHTTMSLGEKRHVTPDGFLVCQDVPMARTGEMMYGPEETPVHSADGVSGVTIRRDEDEVFRPDTILSIIGKPVTNDHPDDLIRPNNWRDNAVGTVISARRGEGVYKDLLLGDIMIMDARAIQDVLEGKREVSCGYDAEYDEIGPSLGRQKNIIYNHLALVDKGRCGPRCAIGDFQYQPPKEKQMRYVARDKKTLFNRLKKLMGSTVNDADIEKALEEETRDDVTESGGPAQMGEVHIHLEKSGESPNSSKDDLGDPNPAAGTANPAAGGGQMDPAIEARFQGIETAVQQIAAAVQKIAGAEEGEPDPAEMSDEFPDDVDPKKAAKANDSAYFADSFQSTMSMAEVIAPGVRLPVFDRAARPGKTYDALCKFRKSVLDLAWTNPATKGLLEDLGVKTLDKSCPTCDKIRNTFRALYVARRDRNNASGPREQTRDNGAVRSTSGITSIAALNKHNAEKYKKTA